MQSKKETMAKKSPLMLSLVAIGLLALLGLLESCSDSSLSNSGADSGSNNGFAPVAAATTQRSGNTNPLPKSGSKRGPASIYPDPNLTPGDTFPGVTAKEVCVSGYSKSVRSVSTEEKAAVYQRYGIPNVTGQHEVDHFISLELGGSNDIKNLWPEPYEPRPGAHEKDAVENALHAAVCSGQMSLQEAQNTIRQDWYAYYLQINGGGTKN